MSAGDGRLVSVQVGRVRTHDLPVVPEHTDPAWRTAFFKDPVAGPIHAGRLGLDGDEQFDLEHHGGPDRALLAYSADHYPAWRDETGLADMGPGAFGENLAVAGQDERTVCIGDEFAIGDVRVQVTQPRGPCSNISRRWNRPGLLKRVVETGWFGWYLRVVAEGEIAAGLDVKLVRRVHPGLDVARVFRLKSNPSLDPAAVAQLALCPELSADYRQRFSDHLATLRRGRSS